MMSWIFWFVFFFSCYFPNVNKNNIAKYHSFITSSTLPQQTLYLYPLHLYVFTVECVFLSHTFFDSSGPLKLRIPPCPFCSSWAPPCLSSSTMHLRLCLPPCCHSCCLISSHLGGFNSFLFRVTDSTTSLFCSVIPYIVVALFLLRTVYLLSHNFLLPVISESNIQHALSMYLILLSQVLTKEKNA